MLVRKWKDIAIFITVLALANLFLCQFCGFVVGNVEEDPIDSESMTLGSTAEGNPVLYELNEQLHGGSDQRGNQILVPDNLYINELMADNDITLKEPSNGYRDWIELYNSGSESLNLTGMYLNDNPSTPGFWQFPNGTLIGPDEFLLVWADGNTELEGLHTTFKLNANGDSVALFASDGVTLIDSVTFKKQIRDTSYGRLPDGSQNWEYLSEPSPGRANTRSSSGNTVSLWVFPLVVILFLVIIILLLYFRKRSGGRI